MNIAERKETLIQQINNVSDAQTLEMLEETLSYYTHNKNKDITDNLSPSQIQELIVLSEEPAEKDTVSEEKFRKLFAKWGTR